MLGDVGLGTLVQDVPEQVLERTRRHLAKIQPVTRPTPAVEHLVREAPLRVGIIQRAQEEHLELVVAQVLHLIDVDQQAGVERAVRRALHREWHELWRALSPVGVVDEHCRAELIENAHCGVLLLRWVGVCQLQIPTAELRSTVHGGS